MGHRYGYYMGMGMGWSSGIHRFTHADLYSHTYYCFLIIPWLISLYSTSGLKPTLCTSEKIASEKTEKYEKLLQVVTENGHFADAP